MSDDPTPPRLSGQHFRITVAEQSGFVNFENDGSNGLAFSGYAIDILEAIAKPNLADFSYEFFPPSGYGELCSPRLESFDNTTASTAAYEETYYAQFNCGQGDVNDKPRSETTTDMYLSSYYVTPARQLANQFTIPYAPPNQGTLGMIGTAIGIESIEDFVKQQEEGKQGHACVQLGAAYVDFLEEVYPSIKTTEINTGDGTPVYDAFVCGSGAEPGGIPSEGCCDVLIIDEPVATQWVLQFSREGKCTANEKPIGIVGEPMPFGLNYYAIGVGNHVPTETVDTLSYWMNVLMTCIPGSKNCPYGNFYSMYMSHIGDGTECGYEDVSAKTSGASIAGTSKIGNWMLLALFIMRSFH